MSSFDDTVLLERYHEARSSHLFYWADKPNTLITLDKNFNRVRTEILGLDAVTFEVDDD